MGVDDAFTGHLRPERYERSTLYRNLGGNKLRGRLARRQVWSSRGGTATPPSWTSTATATSDLYVLNMQGDDHYWENQGGDSIRGEDGSSTSPRVPGGPWASRSFDYNNDGLMDLALTDMHSDMSEGVGPEREKLKSRMQWSDEQLQGGANNIFGNAFWEQTEPGKFKEVSDAIGTENYWPWGVSSRATSTPTAGPIS